MDGPRSDGPRSAIRQDTDCVRTFIHSFIHSSQQHTTPHHTALKTPRHILVVDVAIRPSPGLGGELDDAAAARAPGLLDEVVHEVGAVEQGAAGPQLAVAHPAPLNPPRPRRRGPPRPQRRPRPRRRLPLQQPRRPRHVYPPADGDEGRARRPARPHEAQLRGARRVPEGGCADDDDVERGTGREGVLP